MFWVSENGTVIIEMMSELIKTPQSKSVKGFNNQSLQLLIRLIQGCPQTINCPADNFWSVLVKAKVVFVQGKNVHLGRILTVLWS